VSQRTGEIGMRMALGAQVGHVTAMVLRQGLRLTLMGIAVGLGGAFILMRVLASLLTGGVSATDPVTFAGMAALLIGVSLLACYLPARRGCQAFCAVPVCCPRSVFRRPWDVGSVRKRRATGVVRSY
jgi:ABC-type lipoprotein release transport system permease subunit